MMKEQQTLTNMTSWFRQVFTITRNFAQKPLRQSCSLPTQQLTSIILQYKHA
jgi:hypothetical protein